MTEHGINLYDLAAGYFCEECGQPKGLRLFDNLTGCSTCDDVITTHRCTGRPSLDDLALGESWECRECGTLWSAVEEEDTCSECGRSGPGKTWDLVPGDRIDSAPRHVPQPFTPFRNPFPRSAIPADPPGPFGSCYAMASGSIVHVRPGCRCKS